MIASASPEDQATFLTGLSHNAINALPYLFEFWALPHQLPPEDEAWRTWVIMGGRGAGKTRAGAEWVRSQVEGRRPLDAGRARRVALIGETLDQAREVMVFGDSGILACSPPDRMPTWEATRRRLVWPNGAVAQVYSAFDYESLRGPQFDAAWVDEYGCAAIDKGANEPNKFLDPKSSESALPKYSSGARDDAMQLAYYQAMADFWSDPENNPDAEIYSGRMVDTTRMFAWAWDARPYPQFPAALDVWSDGGNYARGHWLTGRSGSRALSSVVREITARSGVGDVDVSQVHGVVRGYLHEETGGARSALQPLLTVHGVDAIEAEGQLVFRPRRGAVDTFLEDKDLAWPEEQDSLLRQVRDPAAETAGRLQATYIEADSNFDIRAAESIMPDEVTTSVAKAEIPLVLTDGEAESLVERWLAEARTARDRVAFALAPSSKARTGDVVGFPAAGVQGRYRIDRIEDGGLRLAEAVRIDGPEQSQTIQDLSNRPADAKYGPPADVLPVWPLILDLPLLSGDETDFAPRVAAVAKPWPGEVAIYGSDGGDDWQLDALLERSAIAGVTMNDIAVVPHGIVDRGPSLLVDLSSGALMSVTDRSLLNGANAAAIGSAESGWEIFQFRDAVLTEPDRWALSYRLRGQRGTTPRHWSSGSTFLLLDDAITGLGSSTTQIGRERNFRIGPASRPVDDVVFTDVDHSAAGVALRPFAPVHLVIKTAPDGTRSVSWIRQTRVDGDSWNANEVPLAEASEVYLVRVLRGGDIVRESTTTATSWTYDPSMQAADGVQTGFAIEVAQMSDRVGAGNFGRIEING